MKTFEKFMHQVELASQRPLSDTAMAKLSGVPTLPDAGSATFLEAVNEAPVTALSGMEKTLAPEPFTKAEQTVVPVQINRYLEQNDIDLNQFINDRLMRERVIKGYDILDINYLEKGVMAAKSVCRINIFSEEGDEGYGTGFLIAPQILITNNHVLPDTTCAKLSYAEFDYEKGRDDFPLLVKVFLFEPEQLFYTNAELDFTIVGVQNTTRDGAGKITDFPFLTLNPKIGKTKEGNFVSIIQHPDGKMKKVALRENKVTNLDMPKFIRYVTDTEGGSSGSGVFNDKWEVVALHHAGVPKYNAEGKILNKDGGVWDKSQGEIQIDWVENEGVRISSIIYDITTNAAKQYPFLLDHFKPLTDVETISKVMGIQKEDLETGVYYPEEKDKTDRADYYKSLGVDVANAGLDALHKLLEETHTSHHNYSPSKYVYPVVDVHKDGLLRSIYSGKQFTVQELTLADEKVDIDRQLKFIERSRSSEAVGQEAFSQEVDLLEALLPYNCEHVVCQSWFGMQEPMRGDLHHLFACESGCNSFRNNHAYFDFPGYEPTPIDLVEKERLKCGNMENDLFEPEQNKGVVARAVLYFLVRYPKAISKYKANDIEMLKKWSSNQDVTLYEKHRNREIHLMQGNRNPFIDFPELVASFDFSAAI